MSESIQNKFAGFSSAAIHGGHKTGGDYAHLTPIFASSTYVFDSAEQGMNRFNGSEPGYIYNRWGNPNFEEAEEKIAILEALGIEDNGKPLRLKSILHSSGMAAISTMVLGSLKPGDKILSHFSLYGGTEELFNKILEPLQIEPVITDLRDVEAARQILAADKSVRMLYLETPANPTIQCVDLALLSQVAKEAGILVAVDNTFSTPYLQQPFKYDVDFVIHSTTKFLNGHGTAIGGVLVGRDLELMGGKLEKAKRLLGGNSNPFDAFMLVQGIKTLEIRMEKHCANAEKVVDFLSNHPKVARVNYPGLASHPDHAVAKKQMRHPGPMVSFELAGGLEGGKQFINKLQMCVRAVSLGTCDTLISHPASMTHFGVPEADRIKYGITDGLIRMSVGIENAQDIINDLDQALG